MLQDPASPVEEGIGCHGQGGTAVMGTDWGSHCQETAAEFKERGSLSLKPCLFHPSSSTVALGNFQAKMLFLFFFIFFPEERPGLR